MLEWRSKYAFNGVLLYIVSTVFICYISFQRYTGFFGEQGVCHCVECFVLDNYAFCCGKRHSQKFYAGE